MIVPGIDLETARLQLFSDLGKRDLAQLMVVLVMVMESRTSSRPRSVPTQRRRLALSYSAYSQPPEFDTKSRIRLVSDFCGQ